MGRGVNRTASRTEHTHPLRVGWVFGKARTEHPLSVNRTPFRTWVEREPNTEPNTRRTEHPPRSANRTPRSAWRRFFKGRPARIARSDKYLPKAPPSADRRRLPPMFAPFHELAP
jgi:hypothetical protein